MRDRRKQVEEMMEGFMALKHRMAFDRRLSASKSRITPAQWGVVVYIRNHAACTVKDIATAFSMTSSAATQLVEGLVKKGFIERKPLESDRRSVALTLSKKTHQHMRAMREIAAERFLELFKTLTDKEFEQYCVLHRKMVQSFCGDCVHAKD
jgi:DNA-binding MarR family transcriptional regulator